MRIGINLLWLKPKSIGGVEFFTKYLLFGFGCVDESNDFVVFVNSRAREYINEWNLPDRFHFVEVNVDPFDVFRTTLFQYMNMGKLALKEKIDVLFHPTPIYPIRKIKGVKQVVTFHDLLFLHYPQYARVLQRLKYKWSWKASLSNADVIVAISNFTKNDILRNFRVDENRVKVVYNPIILPSNSADFERLSRRFSIEHKNYIYTISSLLPHKNTEVLVRLMGLIKQKQLKNVPNKLVISGIGKLNGSSLERLIRDLNLNDQIVFTGFVTEEEKRSLIENCCCFLFPSLFEGFGMPAVEALMLGVPVITTKEGALEEVTMGCALYVDKPRDENEWLSKLVEVEGICTENKTNKCGPELAKRYDPRSVAEKYIRIFSSLVLV